MIVNYFQRRFAILRPSPHIHRATVAHRRSSALCGSFSFFPCTAASGHPALGPAPSQRRTINMTIGTVKFFNADKGYGFIAPDGGGQDAFVHITALEAAGLNTLNQNDRVTYDLEN